MKLAAVGVMGVPQDEEVEDGRVDAGSRSQPEGVEEEVDGRKLEPDM